MTRPGKRARTQAYWRAMRIVPASPGVAALAVVLGGALALVLVERRLSGDLAVARRRST